MKTIKFTGSFGVFAVAAGLALAPLAVSAQDAAAPSTTPVVSQPAPLTLSPAMVQILRLSQAKVSDSTILAFIQGNGQSYALSADQIIYLKQQGVSDAILNAMLTQPQTVATSPAPAPVPTQAPLNDVVYASPAADTTTYVAPATSVYYPPVYYDSSPYYYPYYGWCGPVVTFGYGGGWGGGYRGGGYHGGGGFHGGGGGFHGGHR